MTGSVAPPSNRDSFEMAIQRMSNAIANGNRPEQHVGEILRSVGATADLDQPVIAHHGDRRRSLSVRHGGNRCEGSRRLFTQPRPRHPALWRSELAEP